MHESLKRTIFELKLKFFCQFQVEISAPIAMALTQMNHTLYVSDVLCYSWKINKSVKDLTLWQRSWEKKEQGANSVDEKFVD